MLNGNGNAQFIGCIGDDEFGRILAKATRDSGVISHYMVTPDFQTGCCASIILHKERSLVAHVSAAEHYSFEHYESPEVQEVVLNSEIFYASGFFMLSSYPTIQAVGKYASVHNKIFILNTSAPFIVTAFWDQFSALIPYADILCGNEDECLAIAEKNNWNTRDTKEIIVRLASFPKENSSRKRIVIITQGASSTLLCHNEEIYEYPVPRIDSSLIVDTNGAGDSFVGGFIAGLSLNLPLDACIDAGHYCAGHIIQRQAVIYEGVSSYPWNTPRDVPKNKVQ
jgi:adenosine kinase